MSPTKRSSILSLDKSQDWAQKKGLNQDAYAVWVLVQIGLPERKDQECATAMRPMLGIVKLSRNLELWRRNQSTLGCRINNLESGEGAE